MLRLTRPECDAGESLEFSDGLLDRCSGIADIKLDYFGSGDAAGVLYIDSNFKFRVMPWSQFSDRNSGAANHRLRVSETRITQSPAEGKEGGVLLIQIARNKFFSSIARQMAQIAVGGTASGQLRVVERLLANGAWHAHRQLSAWIHITEENINQRGTSLNSRTPGFEDGWDMRCSPL